jgi:signal transduction histidine kinase/ActR/RegA family two-component response regulator
MPERSRLNPLPAARIDAWRPWRPWLVALALWLLVTGVAVLALWHLRRTALESQGREMDLLSLALTDEVERGLRGAEEGLQALRLELGQQRLPTRDSEVVQALKTRADLMPLISTLRLLGADGKPIVASDATAAPDVTSFLPRLETLPSGTIALSRPFAAAAGAAADRPAATGAAAREAALANPATTKPSTNPIANTNTNTNSNTNTMVALAIRIDAQPGQPGGWIVGDIPAAMLLGAFGVALPAADARMAIFRRDGVRLAGANLGAPSVDEATVAKRLAERPSLEVRRFSDGSDNLVGLHDIERYGLKVLVSRELDAVLAGWRGAAQLSAAALLVLAGVIAAAVQVVTRAERRRLAAQQALQSQLTRASRLEALGELAGGVAHDFNNVLAGIVGYGEMAQDEATPGSDQARHLDRVLQAAQRGKALIERILSFSRGGARASTVFEIEPVIEEVLSLLAASLRPGVVLERALEAPGARLRGDVTQAYEAVMNLCTNAMQAMPEGGMLSVRLLREHVDTPRVLSHSPLPPGNYLALSVADQGGGIAPDVMEHLFQPFFTTRSAESGTGLGLAVVFGVVSELGGGIDVQSRPAQGARFTLYLPECTDSVALPHAAAARAPEGARQRVLVVDDEPALVALAVELLQALGYAPVGFDDPRAALQALADAPAGFDAVITDEVMPGMTGTQLTQALREHAPQLPVLLISGYGGALLAQRAAAAGVTRVLAKPVRREALARALAELLGRGPPGPPPGAA